jgi:hypothetical protein
MARKKQSDDLEKVANQKACIRTNLKKVSYPRALKGRNTIIKEK